MSIRRLHGIEQAAPFGIRISFGDYARTGVIVTAANLVILMGWIWLRTP